MKLQSIAELFGCGKTQIFKIVKQRDSILSMYEANMPKTYKMGRNSEYADDDMIQCRRSSDTITTWLEKVGGVLCSQD